MKKNQLVTTKSTSLILGKSKSLMGITKKILEAKSRELTAHEGITIIGDLMWENILYTQEEQDAYENMENYGNVMDWDSAMEYAKNLRLGGHDDWRLPTIEELGEVVTHCGGILIHEGFHHNKKPTNINEINEIYQDNYKKKGFISKLYWSSILELNHDFNAWGVLFEYGSQINDSKHSSSYIRCVRSIKKV